MQFTIAKLLFFLTLYYISDVAIKNRSSKNIVNKAKKAKPIN